LPDFGQGQSYLNNPIQRKTQIKGKDDFLSAIRFSFRHLLRGIDAMLN